MSRVCLYCYNRKCQRREELVNTYAKYVWCMVSTGCKQLHIFYWSPFLRVLQEIIPQLIRPKLTYPWFDTVMDQILWTYWQRRDLFIGGCPRHAHNAPLSKSSAVFDAVALKGDHNGYWQWTPAHSRGIWQG